MLARSVFLWLLWTNVETNRVCAHFDEYCKQVSLDIADRMNTYKMILHSGAGSLSRFRRSALVRRAAMEWARFSSQKPMELCGHTWSLVFRSTPKFENDVIMPEVTGRELADKVNEVLAKSSYMTKG